VEHVDAGIRESFHHGRHDRRARQPDVPADGHRARFDEGRVAAADAVGDVLVEFFGNAAANVVGLETVDSLHRYLPWSGYESVYPARQVFRSRDSVPLLDRI